jgi:uncharacterized protein (TIGR02594 family)
MYRVIDTPWNVGAHAAAIRAAGVETVIRYYNHQNSTALPQKRLELAEAQNLAAAGLRLAVVFQARGGAGGNLSDLDAASGQKDGQRALQLAQALGQPAGSAIYFAVDHDFYKSNEIATIAQYFTAAGAAVPGYHVGVYGSGTVGLSMQSAGLARYVWLAAATGWSGTKDALLTDKWHLYQKWPPTSWPGGQFTYDGNIVSAAWSSDYGQFSLGAAGGAAPGLASSFTSWPAAILMEVTARSGLNVRGGPGENYDIEETVPLGTIVHALSQTNEWIEVDLQGDGNADGFMHSAYLRAVSGGLPAPQPTTARPYDVALAEKALGVAEVPGSGNNPRIVMYHNTTQPWSGTGDDVAWCSSFVNYCVEQAGRVGTDSQSARSWEDWGADASANPQEGDIAVFSRTGGGAGPNAGHVAFYVADEGTHVSVLGGNQSNKVKVSSYPKNGQMGSFKYKLLTVRRAT